MARERGKGSEATLLITIVTHNAYWFQGCPSLWGEERAEAHPRVLSALIALYTALHPDLLCLQEVPERATFAYLAESLGMHGLYAPGGIRTAYGGATLVRARSATVRDHSLTQTPTGRPFERVCIAVWVPLGDRHLSLVNVHLSSNRYLRPGEGERVRLAELDALFALHPNPDIVVGDMNATPESAVYRAMVARGYVDAGQSAGTHTALSGRRLDYIWVHSSLAPCLRECHVVGGQTFYLSSTSPTVALSDHRPIVARIAIPPAPGSRE